MSVLEGRGGFPHVFRESITTTGRSHRFPFVSKYLKIRTGVNVCRIFFTEADFTAGTNYIELPVASATTPHGEWEGPVEASEVWLKAITAASVVELVAFQRRG